MRTRFLTFVAILAMASPALPAWAQSLDALDELLAEHPLAAGPGDIELPRWIDVDLEARTEPLLGQPFRVDAAIQSLLSDLEDARFSLRLPAGARLAVGEAAGPLPPLARGRPAELSWEILFDRPVSIIEGRISLTVTAGLPVSALLSEGRRLPGDAAAAVAEEVRRRSGKPGSVETHLEVSVNTREGFVGFTPLVWGSYLEGDGFFVGAGSFMDMNFIAQDLVSDAEKTMQEGRFPAGLELLRRAMVDLRPGTAVDPILSWEALNCEAICLFMTGKSSEAEEAWRAMLYTPEFAEMTRYVLYNLGEAARRSGRIDLARGYFEKASRLKPAFRIASAKLEATRQDRRQE